MRRTRVPPTVTQITKLQGAQRFLEFDYRSTDFRVPENLIFRTLSFMFAAYYIGA